MEFLALGEQKPWLGTCGVLISFFSIQSLSNYDFMASRSLALSVFTSVRGAGGCVWSDLIRMGSSDHLQPAVCAALSTHASPTNIHAIHKLGQSEKYYFLLKMQNEYQ